MSSVPRKTSSQDAPAGKCTGTSARKLLPRLSSARIVALRRSNDSFTGKSGTEKLKVRHAVAVTVRGQTFMVTLDPHNQHTLSWSRSVDTAGAEMQCLPPGSCNLYKYPLVTVKPISSTWENLNKAK